MMRGSSYTYMGIRINIWKSGVSYIDLEKMEMVGYLIETMDSPVTDFCRGLKTKNKFSPIESLFSPIRKLFPETRSRDEDERKISVGMWISFKGLLR